MGGFCEANFREECQMTHFRFFRTALLVVLGFALGSLFVTAWEHSTALAQRDNAAPPNPQADLQRLKEIVAPASHPMVEVGYHAANLWFAAQKKNWPLANYYWGETRNRLRWEVALNPGPKGTDGNPVDMKSTLDGIEHGSLAKVKDTIDKKDSKQFVEEYRHLLEDCYSCHKNVNRAYLRLMVPVTVGQPMINTDPSATWPQ
jgi:hypothetical protein